MAEAHLYSNSTPQQLTHAEVCVSTAAHLQVDTSKNDASCTGSTRKGEAAEGPPDASVPHGLLTSVVQINR